MISEKKQNIRLTLGIPDGGPRQLPLSQAARTYLQEEARREAASLEGMAKWHGECEAEVRRTRDSRLEDGAPGEDYGGDTEPYFSAPEETPARRLGFDEDPDTLVTLSPQRVVVMTTPPPPNRAILTPPPTEIPSGPLTEEPPEILKITVEGLVPEIGDDPMDVEVGNIPQEETSPPQEIRRQGEPRETENVDSELKVEPDSKDDSEARLARQVSAEHVDGLIKEGRKRCEVANDLMVHFTEAGLTRMNFVRRDKVPDPFPDPQTSSRAYKREFDELLLAR
jgi:hypothetical protein